MSAATVRIYDLARDLKQDTKRVIEELRREGADVSVPSNSVSKELAEKIRNKYFPKVEAAPKRFIKVIKKKAEAENEIPQIEPETPERTLGRGPHGRLYAGEGADRRRHRFGQRIDL